MIDNTYSRFMVLRAEGKRRTIADSDDKTVDDENPLFGRINGAPICGIDVRVTPGRKKRDRTETQYFPQGKCKVCQKNMTPMCLDCADTDAVKNEIWVCHTKIKSYCFAQHVHITHEF